jgi:hypothetical protein
MVRKITDDQIGPLDVADMTCRPAVGARPLTMKVRRGATAVQRRADGSAVFPATERSLLGPESSGRNQGEAVINKKKTKKLKEKKIGKIKKKPKAAGFH